MSQEEIRTLASNLRFQKRYAVGQVPVTMDAAADALEVLLDRLEKAESKSQELQEALTNLTAARDRNEKLWIDSASSYEYAKAVLKKYDAAMEASK